MSTEGKLKLKEADRQDVSIAILDESDVNYDDELAVDNTSLALLEQAPVLKEKKVRARSKSKPVVNDIAASSRRSGRIKEHINYNTKDTFKGMLTKLPPEPSKRAIPATKETAAAEQMREVLPRPDAKAVYNTFKCYWGGATGCKAVLHNLKALSLHLDKVHVSVADEQQDCKWDPCSRKQVFGKDGLQEHLEVHLAQVRKWFGEGIKASSLSSASSNKSSPLVPFIQESTNRMEFKQGMTNNQAWNTKILDGERIQPSTVAGSAAYTLFDSTPFGVPFNLPVSVRDIGPYGLILIKQSSTYKDDLMWRICEKKHENRQCKVGRAPLA